MRSRPVIVLPWHLRALLAMPFVLLSQAASAQSTLGSITGTVQDVTGAVVPNASVTLLREETNTQTRVSSDAAGNYTVLNVAPGLYQITVTAIGFPPITAQHLNVQARQQLRYDVEERPEGTTQQVTVKRR